MNHSTATLEKVRTERNRTHSMPITTESLCPECLSVIDATIYENGGKVFMEKCCDAHGFFQELISSDAKFFNLMLERNRARPTHVTNPVDCKEKTCPNGCGICAEHKSSTIMINIDLTNRCNLNCPICFANSDARGKLLELTIDQVREMLDTACSIHEVQPICMQYTGGEPTVHPHFLEALSEAAKRGFTQVQIATNGLKFAQDAEFAAQASEAGLNTVYLQFDGLNDKIYRQTRGRDLTEIKLRAIDNLYQAKIRTVLVPTIVKGLNDKHIGKILKFALNNVDRIAGISWQPVAFTGRIDYEQRLAQRFTVADLAREIEEQTGLVDRYRDWYPFAFVDPFNRLIEAITGETQLTFSCNPICGGGTYLIVNTETAEAIPVPAFVDVEPLMEKLAILTKEVNNSRFLGRMGIPSKLKKLRKYYNQEKGPSGWTFDTFVDYMMDFADFKKRFADNEKRQKTIANTPYRSMLIATMHFQDVYNYQLDRVNRCVIHYAAPDGKIYPFCTYNSGPYHRDRVEQAMGK